MIENDDQVDKKIITVIRGQVCVSSEHILQASIGACVCICIYHPSSGVGAMVHISRSRKDDTTPSRKYVKLSGFHYADKAILRMFELFKKNNPSIRSKDLKLVVLGGLRNEGAILDTLSELEKYKFEAVELDIKRNLYRRIEFDTSQGIVRVKRKKPFSDAEEVPEIFYL